MSRIYGFITTLTLIFAGWGQPRVAAEVRPAGYTTPSDLLEFARQWQDETDFSKYDWDTDRRLEAGDLLGILRNWSSRNDVMLVELPELPSVARPMRLVRIRAGSFQMGSSVSERNRAATEGPRHTVGIGRDFYLTETEVTQAQWAAVMGANPATGWGVGANYPVYSVAWADITKPNGFLGKLRAAAGISGFRLPTEAEWEYACRGGAETRFFFGDASALSCDDACGNCASEISGGRLSDYLWYCGGGSGYATGSKPVGRLAANPFGLFDIHGNLSEWVQDYWHENYMGAPIDGSAWESPASVYRVFRGGGWSADARECRSAARGRGVPDRGQITVGFRVALSAE